MRKYIPALLVTLLLASIVFAAKKSPLSAAELAQITARGRLLAEYDQAAWHSTDAVQALKPPEGTVKRYVAEKTDAGWVVAYGRLNETQDKFLIVYEALQGSSLQQFTVKQNDPPKEDAGFYLHAAKAIDTALRDFQGEKRPYNVMVLPADSGQLYAYVVPAQTEDGIYPLGGDVRYSISGDGSSILVKRQLHKAILMRDLRNPKDLKAQFHTHVLSDVPEDTDVFYVLSESPSVPEYVGTKAGIYVIATDGSIAFTKR